MAMNTKKILIGGIAAGVLFTATDILTQMFILGDRMIAEMEAVAPGMSERLETTEAMAVFIAMNLVFGIALAWLYAAIRPRFGPGPRTAVYAGVYLWVVVVLFYAFYVIAGMLSMMTVVIASTIWLVAMVAGAALAGKLYSEEGSAAY